jgi:hypothetical protein
MQQVNHLPMSKQKRIRAKSEVVPRIPLAGPLIFSEFPGHDGPRPQLSFVLKTLAGDDCGMTEMHLSIPRVAQAFDEVETFKEICDDPLSSRKARDSMIATMRYLADLWIDSGKSGEGENRVDNPSRRNVEYLPQTETPRLVVKCDYFPKNSNSSTLSLTRFIGWAGSSFSEGLSISALFYRLIGDEARWPEIHKDGTQTLKELIFGFKVEDANLGYRDVLRQFGMKVAMYWFARLLDSPFSRMLARCDDCGIYFAYERAPRIDIKGGTYCANCKGKGSARRMKSTRERRTNELVGFAADVWEQWKPDSRLGPRSRWIAERVNRRTAKIEAKSGKKSESLFSVITGRWVTQHHTEIEAEVERRKNAQG